MPVSVVNVVPAYQAVQFTGSNIDDITDWLGLPGSYPIMGGGYGIWLVLNQEALGVMPYDWVLASYETPPRIHEIVPNSIYEGRFVEHPAVPPGGQAPDPEPEPEPDPDPDPEPENEG